LSGSHGPIDYLLVANLVRVSAIWRAFVEIGYLTPAAFDTLYLVLAMPATPYS